jgi:hypothetical protein
MNRLLRNALIALGLLFIVQLAVLLSQLAA